MELIEDAAGVRGREVIPRVIPVASPAAGANWSITVPGGVLWYPQSVTFRATTTAVVANRLGTLQVNDADGLMLSQTSPANLQTASQVGSYAYSLAFTSAWTGQGLRFAAPLPITVMLTSWVLSSAFLNIDVGDVLDRIVVFVLEVEETSYDVELNRDNAQLRGITSNAYPQIRIGDS